MQVDAGRGKLYDALEVARSQWRDVCDVWADEANAAFREHTWDPLDRLTAQCLTCVDRLRTILNDCRRQCDGEGQ